MKAIDTAILAYSRINVAIMQKMLGANIPEPLFELVCLAMFTRQTATKVMQIRAQRGN